MRDGTTGNETSVAGNLRYIANRCPEVVEQLMLRPWLAATGDDPHGSEPVIVLNLARLTAKDQEVALQIAQSNILDSVEYGDSGLLRFFLNLLTYDPEGLNQLLSHPSLAAGAGAGQGKLVPLLYLEPRDQESAAVIETLPWVQDGVTYEETESIVQMTFLALGSQKVLHTLLDKNMDGELVENPWLYKDSLRYLISISAVDEAAALQTIELPIFETTDPLVGTEALGRMADLAESDPAQLQELLFHLELSGGADDDTSITISLLVLKREDPEAVAAIESMAWFQDGIGRPAYRNAINDRAYAYESEESILLKLIEIAERSRELFAALINRPWLQDTLTRWEVVAVYDLDTIDTHDSHRQEGISLRIVDMPFLDTIEEEDVIILQEIESLYWGDLWRDLVLAGELLSHPELLGGITDGQATTVRRISFWLQNPDLAEVIDSLNWVSDGVSDFEEDAWVSLREVAQGSRRVFDAVMSKSWVQDGLTADEASVLRDIARLSSERFVKRAEPEAFKILGMPFLESVDGVDAAAMDSLSRLLSEGDGAYLRQVLSHPTLRDGITDDKGIIVSALGRVVRERPELLDVLLDPERASVVKRAISLPLAGEITLAVISIDTEKPGALDLLERVIRAEEELMNVPLPKRYIALLVANANRYRGSGGPSGIIHVDPGLETDIELIAHEAAHTYWSHSPEWLREGAAELMDAVVRNELTGAPVGPHHASCSLADNLGDLDRLASGLIASDPATGEAIIYSSGCAYSLGLGLFMDLYQNLGREEFQQGFGGLYVMLESEANVDCADQVIGVCYVRAAFVDDASPASAAIAAEIIDRWYYGNPMGRP